MKLTTIKYSVLVLALAVAPAAHASIIEELFLNAITAGTTADITVDDGGIVNCAGDCGGLSMEGVITPHDVLHVTGSMGGGLFTNLSFTVAGGVGSAPAALMGHESSVTYTGVPDGHFMATFTDTQYCSDPGQPCFASFFALSSTNNPDNTSPLKLSRTTFTAKVNPLNLIPADMTIGSPCTITGNATIVAPPGCQDQTALNPVGGTGSLTSIIDTTFKGTGRVQATFTISSSVPEPSTFGLFAFGAGLVAIATRRRKA